MTDARHRELCGHLAELLAYPRGDVASRTRSALALAAVGSPAAAALARFGVAVAAMPTPALQELYTATFDLSPACSPYFGHQLLGDSPVRGPLLARLAGIYAAEGFRPREELADHVSEALAFVAVARPSAERDDLVHDGLVPALERMAAALGAAENPYREVVVAAHALLAARPAAAGDTRPEASP